MNDHQEEYKSVFMAEAEGHIEEINRLLTLLEKDPAKQEYVHALFRITHTLKGNAEGMAFSQIAELAHAMEDLFGVVRDQFVILNSQQFTSLFKASDVLGQAVESIRTKGKVSHRGIRTKLQVITRSLTKKATTDENKVAFLEPEASTIDQKPPTINASPQPDPEHPESNNNEAVGQAIHEPKSSVAEPSDTSIGNEVEPDELTARTTEKAITSGGPGISWSSKDLVKVPVHKLDDLLNLVGELVIERDRILATHAPVSGPSEFSRLNRLASDLQYAVMDVRMVQVGFLFNKYHRTLRDAAVSENKQVRLMLEGSDTEIDRNVLQALSDSLTHLLRNAVAHGIEMPEVRKKKGKPEEGTIILSARSDNDAVMLEIRDDGGGINLEKVRERALSKGLISHDHARVIKDDDLVMYIFEPGFSTQDTVNTLSGRGVGMDVVKRAVESVGGTIRVQTDNMEGTIILLRVPASMAVKGTLLCQLQNINYAIPLIYTEAVVSIYVNELHLLNGRMVFQYLGSPVPVLFLKDLLGLPYGTTVVDRRTYYASCHQMHPEQRLDLVLVESHGRKMALVVDKLLQQKEIVEKPLGPPLAGTSYISGVTILGTGQVCPVLNVVAISNAFFMASLTESA